MKNVSRLGNLQLKILKLLWDRREATVADLHQSLLAEADLAYTTIATMLRKMEDRGLVRHRAEGRTFVYQAVVEADAVTRNLATDFLDRLFEGSLSAMVNHLLSHREVTRDELAKIEQLIADRKKTE